MIGDARRVWELVRKVVPALAALVAVIAFVVAGNWQRGRMHDKETAERQYAAASAATPVALPRDVADWAPWRYRRVDVEGRFDAARQILIDNRVYRGRFGYHVITPLLTRDGRAVLVNRGFVPAGPSRDRPPAIAAPGGEVAVRGRINLPPSRFVELKPTSPGGVVWQHLDPVRFAEVTGIAVLPIVVEAEGGAHDGLARDWPKPDTASGKHLGYMLQWYAFAVLAAGLWVFFTFFHRRRA